MTAGKLDFIIEQGATFRRVISWKNDADVPFDLTDYTARMQVRAHLSSPIPIITLTTENDGLTIDGEDGQLVLTISAEATDDLTLNDGVYDLEVESPEGVVTRLLQGRVIIERSVTR